VAEIVAGKSVIRPGRFDVFAKLGRTSSRHDDYSVSADFDGTSAYRRLHGVADLAQSLGGGVDW